MTKSNLSQEAEWRSLTGEYFWVDAGSRGGFRDMPLLHPQVHMYSIDADTTIEPPPQRFASFQHFPLALYSSEGQMDLFVAERPGMSSLLEFDEAAFIRHFGLMPGSEDWRRGLTPTHRQKTHSQKTDDFFRGQNLARIDFFKLDTQGTELEILYGACDYLSTGRISVIETEVSFLPVYRNQCTFSEIDLFLKKNGFLFIDCRFYPDSVYAPSRARAIEDVALKESLRFSAGGDAIYALDPRHYHEDPVGSTIRSAVLLNQMGYVSFAFNLLIGSGQSAKTAEYLLKATTAKSDGKTKFKSILKNHLPPWAYRMAYKFGRSLLSELNRVGR